MSGHLAPLVLLPPSEGKTAGGSGEPWSTGERRTADLDGDRRLVIAALTAAMHGDPSARAKLLGVGAGATERATRANLAIDQAPTCRAIDRYDGVLYGALDHRSLGRAERRRLDAQVLIFSGLWGVVAPDDPIPDYKCKMGASLPPLGRLATWWRPRLAPYLDDRSRRRVVWNLLPNEHDAACTLSPEVARVIRVRFLDDVERNGERTLVAVNHWNKLLKGSLVRHLLTTQLTDPAGLAEFEHPEQYRFAPALTETRGNVVTVALVARR